MSTVLKIRKYTNRGQEWPILKFSKNADTKLNRPSKSNQDRYVQEEAHQKYVALET